LAACGDQATAVGRSGKKVEAMQAGLIPPDLLGLRVTQEETKDYVAEIDRSYLEKFGLYSLREGDVLQATLQVSKFVGDADYQSETFRARLIAQIGSSKAEAFRMGDTTLSMTTGTKQQIAVWFRDGYMFVLSVRDDYPQPRKLLRTALGVKP
jgi:hypothetical protein